MPLVPQDIPGRITVFNEAKMEAIQVFTSFLGQIISPCCLSLVSCIGQGEQQCQPLGCVRAKCHIHLLGSVDIREAGPGISPHTGESILKGTFHLPGTQGPCTKQEHSCKITHYLLPREEQNQADSESQGRPASRYQLHSWRRQGWGIGRQYLGQDRALASGKNTAIMAL